MKRVIEGVICIILLLFLGCAEEKTGPGNIAGGNYRGDGTFFDKGPRARVDRYLLKLGDLDFSRKTTRTFKVTGLPEVRFTLGFTLRGLPPLKSVGNDKMECNRANVSVLLKTKEGKEVLNCIAPFHEWTWSGSMNGTERFVYLRGDPGQAGASGFTPREGEEYLLTIGVEPLPGSAKVVPASLEMTGGGSKVP